MKYTIFGNCVLHPDPGIEKSGGWGPYFDEKHKGNIKWYMSYEQSNLQIATQVMLCSNPDTINIVQTNPLHRIAFIDSVSPRSYNLEGKAFGDSCFADIQTQRIPEREEDHLFTTSTWQNALGKIKTNNGGTDFGETFKTTNNDKDENFLKSYRERYYIPQQKWELYLSLCLICKHAKATGHDIRIIPRRTQDFRITMLSDMNRMHVKDLIKHIDHNMLFWYNKNGKDLGADNWPEDEMQYIIDSQLQPWLDKDI